MIRVLRKIPQVVQRENQAGASRIALLKAKINSERYLDEAIQRMALVMSNEILGIPQGGTVHERQRTGKRQ
ncbi:hypothetical protein AGMMS49942_11140 [Spirochaetia bacterium]|nr:hypothetical protein AGMMS49942_11140 [Spirochaetia bacterium]